ncbi:MAG: glycine reductase [Deltaproteobacteria bacterium]|nr:glycine reductase [Deltaproteobacteria bacterium]
MPSRAVVRNAAFCLAHVPDLVRYGSKPRRELAAHAEEAERVSRGLRSEAAAIRYPPSQVFIGNLSPADLADLPRPWFQGGADALAADGNARGPFGEIAGEAVFYGLLQQADSREPPLFEVSQAGARALREELATHPLYGAGGTRPLQVQADRESAWDPDALALRWGDVDVGRFHGDRSSEGRDDPNLAAPFLLENLCAKASGGLALDWLLHDSQLEPEAVDYVISCGEEAVGDRYQRGGGGMAKAIGEFSGCARASGMDVKNFCAGPASALVSACALVQAGLYERVVVVAGGSVAKLGMKFQGCLERDMPILEDCLASLAILVTADDGESPFVHLEPGAVGSAPIGASASDEALYRDLLVAPLERLGLTIPDIDRFAPELHNPEIMELSGSGDVARKNFRSIAAMAVRAGQIEREEMQAFVERISMPGFAPTQGHVPSGVVYLGHALRALRAGEVQRIMIVSKASLFLGRITELYDGVSFVLEANPGAASGSKGDSAC